MDNLGWVGEIHLEVNDEAVQQKWNHLVNGNMMIVTMIVNIDAKNESIISNDAYNEDNSDDSIDYRNEDTIRGEN